MLKTKTIYWVSTLTLFAMMLATGILYFVFYDKLVVYFISYGYPIFLIYALGIGKIIGCLIVLSNKNKFLTELAYMGFFYNFILAFFAHIMINEIDPFPSISIILLLLSYFTGKKVRP
jgi:cytosine/uracil/thiamine/allantoin permease